MVEENSKRKNGKNGGTEGMNALAHLASTTNPIRFNCFEEFPKNNFQKMKFKATCAGTNVLFTVKCYDEEELETLQCLTLGCINNETAEDIENLIIDAMDQDMSQPKVTLLIRPVNWPDDKQACEKVIFAGIANALQSIQIDPAYKGRTLHFLIDSQSPFDLPTAFVDAMFFSLSRSHHLNQINPAPFLPEHRLSGKAALKARHE